MSAETGNIFCENNIYKLTRLFSYDISYQKNIMENNCD